MVYTGVLVIIIGIIIGFMTSSQGLNLFNTYTILGLIIFVPGLIIKLVKIRAQKEPSD